MLTVRSWTEDPSTLADGGSIAASTLREAGQKFGDYEILREIAQGGMGVVYQARQISLNRVVALKMILGERLAGPGDIQRFQLEAQAAARLRHPHIVRIHEVGSSQGENFYSMDFISGQSLAQMIRDHPLPAQKAAQYLRKVALAIDYAHREGVLHRDLKPANILVDSNDEPQVTDFGLAKLLHGDTHQTLSGTILGTPSYMSPEQAAGQGDQVEARSDVYSLGAILYELLLGRPPFRAETTLATLKLVLETEPVPPRRMNPRIPVDLETICLKCLEKQPAKRYPTAATLAEELRRFLDNEAIEAHPVGPVGKAARWCRRKPALAAVTGIALALLLVISVGSPIAAFKLNNALALAENRERAARQNAYAADMNIIQEAIERRNFGHALKLLRSYVPLPGQVDLRGWEWRHFWQLCQGDELKTVLKHTGRIQTVKISADGTWAAFRDDQGAIRLWNSVEQKPAELIGFSGSSGEPTFSDDGRTVAIPCPGGSIRFWDLRTLAESRPAIVQKERILQLDLRGDDLAVLGERQLRRWSLSQGRVTGTSDFPPGQSVAVGHKIALAAVANGGRLTVWSEERNILWQASTDHIPSGGHLAKLAFSPDETVLVSGVALAAGGKFSLQVWDVASGQKKSEFLAHTAPITKVKFSSDGQLLASTSIDQSVLVWDTRTWRQVAVLKGHTEAVTDAAFFPDPNLLLTGSEDGTLKLWKLDANARGNILSLPEHLTVEAIGEYRGGLSPDNRVLGMVQNDGSGVLVNLQQRTILREIHLQDETIAKTAIGRRGELLAAQRKAGGIRLWRTESGDRLADWDAPGEVRALAFSLRNRYLAASGTEGFRVWDIKLSQEVLAIRNKPTNVTHFVFSADEKRMVCGQTDGVISLWNVAEGSLIRAIQAHQFRVVRLAISWDEKRVASTSTDRTVAIFDLETGNEAVRIPGGQSSFYRVSFSPDGTRLCVNEWASGYIFDLAAERQVARLNTFIPVFLDSDTVLGFTRTNLWHWSPPTLREIDAREEMLK